MLDSQNNKSSVEEGNGDVGPQLHEDDLHPEHVDHQVDWVLNSGDGW